MPTLVFDGLAYGMLLFVLAIGLAVTLGLMRFVNLAHGAFAMGGGYVAVLAVRQGGWPFLASLPLAFVAMAVPGALLAATLLRPMLRRTALEQVLFSIGLAFMAMAAADFAFGPSQQSLPESAFPAWLRGRTDIGQGAWQLGVGHYRLFIMAVGVVLALVLQCVLSHSRFGARLRAAVDDPRVAAGLGLHVDRLNTLAFSAGCGLAGLGGALGTSIVGLDPALPLRLLVHVLVVVAVGGTTTVTGPLAGALLLGVADVAGTYFFPQMGAFALYLAMVLVLLWRPHGLFVARGRTAA